MGHSQSFLQGRFIENIPSLRAIETKAKAFRFPKWHPR